jgi:hypothetical protein
MQKPTYKTVNAVQVNDHCLLWELYWTRNTLCGLKKQFQYVKYVAHIVGTELQRVSMLLL